MWEKLKLKPLRKNTKEPEFEDELLTYVNEFSAYRVHTKYIMDEPVIKWASPALPAPQLMTRNLLPADFGSVLCSRHRPPIAIWKERECDKMLLYFHKQFMTTV